MALATELTDQEAQTIAERVLAHELQRAGFDHAEVHSGPDHDGDPALFVTAVLKPGTPVIPGDLFVRAHGALDDELRLQGERRFPYLKLSRPDDEVGEASESEGPK